MSEYKYKFSVITAVYNVELFLAETIDSLIEQTIGFENVQLILVNDGSTDNSGAICNEYAAKYPDNIFVIHKENGGVSSARNVGLDLVKGKYVNFLDGDDKLDVDTLKTVWKFMEKNYNKTDIVAIPLKFFDGARGNHMLNYKFSFDEKEKLADLKEDFNNPQMSSSSSFIKSEFFTKDNLRFDEKLAFAEDAKVIQIILLNKQTLGLINSVSYLYRRRKTGTVSAVQSSAYNSDWYLPVMENYHLEILQLYLNKFGELPKFIQMTLMYDLQWRIKREDLAENIGLSEDDRNLYLSHIKTMLRYIDDDIIMAQRNIWDEHKLLALELKYDKAPKFIIDEAGEMFTGYSLESSVSVKGKAIINLIEIKDGILKITGNVNLYNLDYHNIDLYLLVNGEKIELLESFDNYSIAYLDKKMVIKKGFYAEVSLDDKTDYAINIGANINGTDIVYNRLQFGRFAPLSTKYDRSYACFDKHIISSHSGYIFITKNKFIRKAYKEFRLLKQIAKRDGKLGIGAAGLRVITHIRKAFKIKPLWLISDRPSFAGDNGEAFFRYVRENHKNIDARFVIKSSSPDYLNIKKIGPVVETDSTKHKMLSIIAQYIISSQGENEIFNPLRSRVEPFRNIWAQVKLVFLQHGVIKDDLSSWLNKFNKNFYGFVTSAKAEYDSIVDGDYRYSDKEIWLTGLPRFDRLSNDDKKRITIMPTWRKYLTTGRDPIKDMWNLIPDFEESEFYKFYNNLLSNKKLLEAAKKYGYVIDFFPHPNLQAHLDRFTVGEQVNFIDVLETPYRDMYSHSSLLITDYSSAIFDFVYLRKPVIYTHFDKEEFFGGGHSYSAGYFDYERDGFGEVEYDLDSTVNRIIEYMENGCQLKDKYRERIDNFFAFDDRNNCQRVYEKLMEK